MQIIAKLVELCAYWGAGCASPKQTMKINEVIEDIIAKVKAKESGIYYYQCAVTNDLYELIIGQNEKFFHDVGRGKFYTFED